MSQLCCMQMAVLSKCTCFKGSLQSQHCILEQEQAQRQLRPFTRMQQGTAETSLGNTALKMFAEPCYISNSGSSSNLTHKMGRTKLEGEKQVAGKLEINLYVEKQQCLEWFIVPAPSIKLCNLNRWVQLSGLHLLHSKHGKDNVFSELVWRWKESELSKPSRATLT